MKTIQITFTEDEFKAFDKACKIIPKRYGHPIVEMYKNNTGPIGGGGGGGAPKPKKEK